MSVKCTESYVFLDYELHPLAHEPRSLRPPATPCDHRPRSRGRESRSRASGAVSKRNADWDPPRSGLPIVSPVHRVSSHPATSAGKIATRQSGNNCVTDFRRKFVDMERELIELQGDLRQFFSEIVEESVRAQSCAASQACVIYLSALLADYGKPAQLQRDVLSQPFTLLLQRALESQGPERFNRLRCLGDDVLYVSGFFGDHLVNRGVEVPFVAALGARAYNEAASILRASRSDSSGPDVFGELSDNFESFVAVVNDVADALFAMRARGPKDVLNVYERWQRTRSGSLADTLATWGLIPQRGDGTLH